MPRGRKYPQELMDRGVRLVFESKRPIAQVAADLGVHSEALRKRVRQAEADSGKRTNLLTTQGREEIKKLRKENYELRRANEILKSASVRSTRQCDAARLGVEMEELGCPESEGSIRRSSAMSCGSAGD